MGAGKAVMLDFRGVGMTFPDGTVALDDVDVEIRRGEFVALLGPSGCGKSTMLRIASGLQPWTAGEVVANTDQVGYVFQDATLLPWRTVEKNVSLFAELEGFGKAQAAEAVARTLEVVGLTQFAKHYPRQLSGGMKMRVSLARSLVLKPELFMFDEPFAALDEITRQMLNDEVLRLYQAEEFTGIFVTHSVAEAVYLSSRVVVMAARPGRVNQVFDVPFGYPRSVDLRFDPAFAELTGRVSQAMREVH